MLKLAATVLTLAAAPSAAALTISDTSGIVGNGRTRVAGVYAASRVGYEVDGLPRAIDRRLVAAEVSHGLSKLDAFVQIGLITTTTMRGVVADGGGYVYGAGLRAEPFEYDRTSILVHALYTRQRETLTGIDERVTLDSYDVHAGVTWKQAYNTVVQPYFGAEIVPRDGGTKTTSSEIAATTIEADVERDGLLSGRIGCNFQLTTGLSVRPEVVAGGERTMAVTGGYAF